MGEENQLQEFDRVYRQSRNPPQCSMKTQIKPAKTLAVCFDI